MEGSRFRNALIGLLIAAACPATAMAGEDIGWYVGAGVGQSTFDLPVPDAMFYVENYRQGSATESYQVLGGFRTSRYLALEMTYVHAYGHTADFTFECGGRPTCQGLRFDVHEENRSQRLDMAVVATVPVGSRFELIGKLGLSRSRHRIYRSYPEDTYSPGAYHLAYDDLNTGLVKGWGARFLATPDWAIRVQHEWANEVGGPTHFTNSTEDGRPATVENYWIGAEYRF